MRDAGEALRGVGDGARDEGEGARDVGAAEVVRRAVGVVARDTRSAAVAVGPKMFAVIPSLLRELAVVRM